VDAPPEKLHLQKIQSNSNQIVILNGILLPVENGKLMVVEAVKLPAGGGSKDPIPESGHERLWQNAMREKDIQGDAFNLRHSNISKNKHTTKKC